MIALIGMSGLFPGCASLDSLWTAIEQGRDCLTRFSAKELLAAGVPQHVIDSPGYVPVRGWFDAPKAFDPQFFGYTDTEAQFIDPQQRLFLQETWLALEHAGYRPDRTGCRTGVFAGCGVNTHLLFDVLGGDGGLFDDDPMLKVLGNEKDFLPTRVSYKLGLTGPSVNVQTACSTSLAAVHLACQSLLAGECDMAIAGGASVFARPFGYFSQRSGIVAPDGVCRPFDASGRGFVPGNGVAVVCLKRLDDAIADGDRVHLVIRGSAMVNDGARKGGFTAPSLEGQMEAISDALAVSGVPAGAIQYVEAHGTATELGDPVEFAALQAALAGYADPRGCTVGALKGNIGHLDTAAGAAALIKMAMVMDKGVMPPIANFNEPNPQLDMSKGRFLLPKRAVAWLAPAADRWACINSLGLGGTNVHLVLSGPQPAVVKKKRPRAQLVVVSARSPALLSQTAGAIATQVAADMTVSLDDIAFTLGRGRFAHEWRRAVVASRPEELAGRLASVNEATQVRGSPPRIAFVFPGGGSQHDCMASGLHEHEPAFQGAYDACRKVLFSRFGIGIDIGESHSISSPVVGLSELFAVEWGLAALWQAWGIKPAVMLGHSAGEYVAAALAGIFSLEDALELVVARGQLMATLPPGGMLSIPLSEEQARQFVSGQVCLAAVNSRTACVLSAEDAVLQELMQRLQRQGVPYRRLHIDVAAHSHLVDSIVSAFESRVSRVRRSAPTLPVVSSVTGKLLTDEQACDSAYWARHLRDTVRFSTAAQTLLDVDPAIVVEVGPGQGLTALMREAARHVSHTVHMVPSLPEAGRVDTRDGHASMLEALGAVWACGGDINPAAVHHAGTRVPLPTTLFERRILLVPASEQKKPANRPAGGLAWVPAWVPEPPGPPQSAAATYWVLGNGGASKDLARRLQRRGAVVTRIVEGPSFQRVAPHVLAVRPGNESDFVAALAEGPPPAEIVHMWGLDPTSQCALALERGAASLLVLHRALGSCGCPEVAALTVVTQGCVEDACAEPPFGAATCGFGFALSGETQAMAFLGIDLDSQAADRPELAASLIEDELMHAHPARRGMVILRGLTRRVRRYVPTQLAHSEGAPGMLVHCLFITGGFGGMALAVARHYAERGVRRIALAGPRLPSPGESADHECNAIRAMGVSLVMLKCDVAELQQIRAALGEARMQLGHIDTIIHAAGRLAGGVAALKTEAQLRHVTQPKMDGSLALVEALKEEPHDRLVLFSALDACLGTPGLTDHCAANAFLDAMAHWASRVLGTAVTAIAWAAWSETGQAASSKLPADIERLRTSARGTGLTNAEGCHILEGALASRLPNVVICRKDLPDLIEQTEKLAAQFLREAVPVRRDRVNALPHEEPENDMEAIICELFEQVLGIERVGVTEDFFALGGHSLLGLSLLNQLQHAFDIRLPLTVLIRNPSARRLTSVVEETLLNQIAEDAIDGQVASGGISDK